ncbi:MAG: hypothetical protein RIR51_1240 [Bacteroidota bacterium]
MKNQTKITSILVSCLVIAAFLVGFTKSYHPNIKEKAPVGVITYSYRSMPSKIEDIIKYCKETGVSDLELMGEPAEIFAGMPENPVYKEGHWIPRNKQTEEQKAALARYADDVRAWRENAPMEKFKELRKLLDKNGIRVYAFKPNALNENNSDAEIEYAMEAAKILGAGSVTVELPRNGDHSLRLGKLGEKHKMYIGYHAHLQATDTAWDEALAQSPYNSMNLDCGHYIAAGGNNTVESLLALIKSKNARITSMHLKDRKNKENGQANMPWGEGNTPILEVVKLVRDNKYFIPMSIELEYNIPEGSNAVEEVKKCREYVEKGI